MKHSSMVLSLIAASIMSVSVVQTAHAETTLSNCVIQQPLPGKLMTGAFLTFKHHGETVDIVSVEVPSVTANAELHQMEHKDNIMVMAPLQDLKIAAGERVFRKGGDHVMLMQIPEDKLPKVGQTHTISFKFSDQSTASCEAIVKTAEELIKESKAEHAQHKHAH